MRDAVVLRLHARHVLVLDGETPRGLDAVELHGGRDEPGERRIELMRVVRGDLTNTRWISDPFGPSSARARAQSVSVVGQASGQCV